MRRGASSRTIVARTKSSATPCLRVARDVRGAVPRWAASTSRTGSALTFASMTDVSSASEARTTASGARRNERGRWRAAVFAPEGDGVRARLGSDAWRVGLSILGLAVVFFAYRQQAHVDQWVVKLHRPAPDRGDVAPHRARPRGHLRRHAAAARHLDHLARKAVLIARPVRGGAGGGGHRAPPSRLRGDGRRRLLLELLVDRRRHPGAVARGRRGARPGRAPLPRALVPAALLPRLHARGGLPRRRRQGPAPQRARVGAHRVGCGRRGPAGHRDALGPAGATMVAGMLAELGIETRTVSPTVTQSWGRGTLRRDRCGRRRPPGERLRA